jgi:excisionase family DNA binding protein
MESDHLRAFSIPEVAERLGMSRSNVWRLIDAGRIPSRRLGGRRVIPAAWLAQFLELGENEQPQPREEALRSTARNETELAHELTSSNRREGDR